MARPLRLEYAGALYHVAGRAKGRARLFRDDRDRERFLSGLAAVAGRLSWVIHAYCLLDVRYELLVETPKPNLARGMRQVNGGYTQAFNRRHRRQGPIFRGRFKAVLAERELYLVELARWLALAPVRAGLAPRPDRWRWSSYRAAVGRARRPAWLETSAVVSAFGKGTGARARFAAFVAEGAGIDPLRSVRRQIFLGSDRFVARLRKAAGRRRGRTAAGRRQGPRLRRFEREAVGRDAAIRAAWADGEHTLGEIGRHFGLHESTVSRIVNARAER
jgi:REP element-mobilizing transposase RayT